MAEDLLILKNSTKEAQYISLVPQIKALLEGEHDLVANLANIAAALKEQFDWFWVGFYWVKEGELVLGPFQGPVACTRIGLRQKRSLCLMWMHFRGISHVLLLPGLKSSYLC